MSCDVSVASCSAYSAEACRTALEQVLAPLGGLDWVRPGMRIAVKANLVSFLKPEAAATTHPALLRALTELLRARGASVVIGDSPGGLYTAAFVGRVYAAAGLREAEAAGAALNQNFAQRTAEYPQGTVCRRFPFTAWLDDAARQPPGRGVPAVGPLPSIPTTASQMDRTGRTNSSRSTIIRAKSAGFAY